MATKPTQEQLDAQRAAEEKVYATAQHNAAIVVAAGITNGMPADEVRRRILAVAAPGGVTI